MICYLNFRLLRTFILFSLHFKSFTLKLLGYLSIYNHVQMIGFGCGIVISVLKLPLLCTSAPAKCCAAVWLFQLSFLSTFAKSIMFFNVLVLDHQSLWFYPLKSSVFLDKLSDFLLTIFYFHNMDASCT